GPSIIAARELPHAWISSRNLTPSRFKRATVASRSAVLTAQWSTSLPRVLTSPPPGHGRIEIEISSKLTPPAGSRTNPVFANDGQVGGAYVLVWQSPDVVAGADAVGAAAPAPLPWGRRAPRCSTYHCIAHSGCS